MGNGDRLAGSRYRSGKSHDFHPVESTGTCGADFADEHVHAPVMARARTDLQGPDPETGTQGFDDLWFSRLSIDDGG